MRIGNHHHCPCIYPASKLGTPDMGEGLIIKNANRFAESRYDFCLKLQTGYLQHQCLRPPSRWIQGQGHHRHLVQLRLSAGQRWVRVLDGQAEQRVSRVLEGGGGKGRCAAGKWRHILYKGNGITITSTAWGCAGRTKTRSTTASYTG